VLHNATIPPACAAASSVAAPITSLRSRRTTRHRVRAGLYLANAGSVIDFHQETVDDEPDAVLASVARIGVFTDDVLRYAAVTDTTQLRASRMASSGRGSGGHSVFSAKAPRRRNQL
jgi:hypothetical protein